MKKLSQLINEAKQGLNLQEGTVNYVNKSDLEKYLEICKNFINDDAKYVVGWLIEHNDTYVKDLTAPSGSVNNALADFYNAGVPKDQNMKELYKRIGLLNKAGLILQIPVFQTKDQLEGILDKKVAPDEVFLDLTSEKGRNEVAKKYNALVWKIVRSFKGKSNFTLDELYSIGLEGLTWAMNNYGKSHVETQKKKTANKEDSELDEILNSEKEKARKQYTFIKYAGYFIRIAILEAIKNESHLVRIPVSQQNRERKETGKNTKSMSISGETSISKDKEGNSKSLFDTISGSENGHKNMDQEDIDKLWTDAKKILDKKFTDRQMGIFTDFLGVFGKESMSGKEVMKKYGLKNQSEISNNNSKIKSFMMKDPKLSKILREIYTLYAESRNENDDEAYSPIYLDKNVNGIVEKELEEQNRYPEKEIDF
ncbi:MAG: hypothetical protein J1F35_03340 [Erysipelotrichales bacterium]|nr:hypothetical protein [Erysipelotrichales bacterium]